MKIIILVVVLQTILVAGVGAGGWFLGKGSAACPNGDAAVAGADGEDAVAAGDQGDPIFTEFEPFLLNILDGDRRRFLQVQITAKSFKPEVTDAVDKYGPRIRGEVLATFSRFTSEQLDTPEGRTAMATQGKDTLNKVLSEEAGIKAAIADVYITKLVIQ